MPALAAFVRLVDGLNRLIGRAAAWLILATVLIIMVPIFYYVIERLRERRGATPAVSAAARQPAE